MADTIREIDGMPLRWGDANRVIHAVEGASMAASDPIGTRLLWTVCGKHDVPANTGVKSRLAVTCPDCHEATQ